MNISNDAAALTIQKAMRNHHQMMVYYRDLCRRAPLEKMPTAPGGTVTVYLPPELPTKVLKEIGNRTMALHRYQMAAKLRSFIKEHHITQIIVPKATLCGTFLIEDRLSINIDRNYNKNLYRSNAEAFDKAAQEMLLLFQFAYISSLTVTEVLHTQPHFSILRDRVRYDNTPLTLRNGRGEINLIDLERMAFTPEPDRAVMRVATLFPLNITALKTAAHAQNISTEALDNFREMRIKLISFPTEEVSELRHMWMEQNGIAPPHTPLKLKEISAKEILAKMEGEEEKVLSFSKDFLKLLIDGLNQKIEETARLSQQSPPEYRQVIEENQEKLEKHSTSYRVALRYMRVIPLNRMFFINLAAELMKNKRHYLAIENSFSIVSYIVKELEGKAFFKWNSDALYF